ncbi:hypothetical protein IX39_04440 [Chryseobacterium formosense]|uniref:Uncharacterized protein n=1 Tax=Chryseobacterium formosense TaxID=236814 RepID=A0A085Z641_9FLAO|nr:hypothetical protein [Chryseobacterium formosense]KFE99904.1 hypothetical protein IX39_04440 [Chryseobacterium formosense]SFT59832.1 hypothetical protein SAMN05421857_1972 [Chryseobacterium formosense]
MTHEFTRNDWQQTGTFYSLQIQFEQPLEKPIVQVYKYVSEDTDMAAQLISNMSISVISAELNSILLQFGEAFKGYIVIY